MTAEQSAFFKTAVPAAQASMAATGVPASVTLAQAILESGWGATALAKTCNNFFGIKATNLSDPSTYREYDTREGVRGKLVTEQQPFEKYVTAADSFTAHGSLLAKAKRYARCMAVKAAPEQFCVMLQACGYSTSVDAKTGQPNYARMLIVLMREFDLTQYDKPAPDDPSKAKAAA